jgi:DNA repair exonuclease SbcCD nuclease subunit
VYLIRGNHDALSVVAPAVSWPADIVHEFDAQAPASIVDERSGAVLHGQSYADRRAPGDLAAKYPQAHENAFNIGVLHTSLTGDPNHIPYAPTTPANLAARGYDYWALGHVHQRAIVQTGPHVVFAGNTQGRHIKEAGAKGCLLVSVDHGDIQCAFRETDVIRWKPLDVALAASADETELFDALQARFREALSDAGGRPVIARLAVSGACALHEKLAAAASRERILAEIRNQANDCEGELWIEQISCSTRSVLNIDELRQAGDVVGELLRSFAGWQQDDDALRQLATHLEPLFNKVGDALGEDNSEPLTADNPQLVRRWLAQAEGLLLAELAGGEA